MRPLPIFGGAALAVACSLPAHAATIDLESYAGGTYTYELGLPAYTNEYFVPGDTVTLTGLSGVTGASLVAFFYNDFFTLSYTSTSVTLTDYSDVTIYNLNSASPAEFADVFSVTAAGTPEGLVDYSISADTASTGTVEGPAVVVVTPEPSGMVLLGTGLAVAGAGRRRRA